MPQFIGECFKQYFNHQICKNEEKSKSAYAANKPSLTSQISKSIQKTKKNKGKQKMTQKGKINAYTVVAPIRYNPIYYNSYIQAVSSKPNHANIFRSPKYSPECNYDLFVNGVKLLFTSKKSVAKMSILNPCNNKKKLVADALASKKKTYVAEETADSDEEMLMALKPRVQML
ncbi:hypothetical protein BGY98DRAFT_937516 [Russula aff. rugulosa BPL654]|nr:hypothetical protein BGY98DRAFT_937516 [Russula aff. rugulosa BPL654]